MIEDDDRWSMVRVVVGKDTISYEDLKILKVIIVT
jgi:hypothetical protein